MNERSFIFYQTGFLSVKKKISFYLYCPINAFNDLHIKKSFFYQQLKGAENDRNQLSKQTLD
jgi:hypothetical protein